MKKIALIGTILLSFSTIAQEGVISYKETVKMTRRVPPQFADMIPKEFNNDMILVFNKTESTYRAAEREENVAEEIGADRMQRMMTRFKRMRATNERYRNHSENVTIEKQNFMGRDFLIEGADEEVKWKMESQQKKILGYLCMKAVYMRNDTLPVTAWWTPQIPLATGPGNDGKLPGLVLALDINNGDMVTVATNIDLRVLTEEEMLMRPEKGKKMSREEFNKMRDEKIEEMREMGGGRGFRMRGN